MYWSPEDVTTKVCNCPCHIEGTQIMHMMACCQFCYDKYLTEDGEVITEKLESLQKESYLETLKRQSLEKYNNAKRMLELIEAFSIEELKEYEKMTLKEQAELIEESKDV
jgi:hypothetical protein